ncbi:MAG: efflux RND transporter periplasmic adaptor subunit [Rubrivivax sp.]|jgi:RND family efflux transporter MFP subunit|nr:efflux RND transporter periplasmic adaptor subunit [Rubrivivax sp.]
MTRRARWAVALLVAALLAAAVGRGLWQRQAERAAASRAAAPAAAALELAPGDVARAREVDFARPVPVSGGLVAVESAIVKAKVAAEVRELAVREGDAVRRGQRIGRLDDTEVVWRLRQAEDQAAAARAQLEIAERTLANNRALVDQGFISRNALDTSISSAAGAAATLQAARAAAEIARKAVADTAIVAPIDGIVAQRFAQPGERVGVDARLVEIVDLSRLELAAAVPAEDAAALAAGQPARLEVDGLATQVAARVARIAPSTQPGTRAVMVYLAVDGGPGLRQGLFARGRVDAGSRRALVVPQSALRHDAARPYVIVVEDGVARHRSVEPGERGEAVFDAAPEPAQVLRSGLAPGALVLRGSTGALRDGTPVVLPAAAAAAVAAAASAAR